MASCVWDLVYESLTGDGFDVYSPGQHKGNCTSPYLVVNIGNAIPFSNFSSGRVTYDILCYVPKDRFSTLEGFVNRVEKSLSKIYPTLRPLHSRTPAFLDDSVEAYMVSTQYVNYFKN